METTRRGFLSGVASAWRERVVGDREADTHLKREQRKGFEITA